MKSPEILLANINNLFDQSLELTERIKWAEKWKDGEKVIILSERRNAISNTLVALDEKIYAYIKKHNGKIT